MFKFIALSAILSLNICCLGSSEVPAIRHSDSGTFYVGSKPVTAHEAARKAKTPLDVKLDGFLPVLRLGGVQQSITAEEYVAIQRTNELGFLAAQHRLLPPGHYPELTAAQNKLAHDLITSEKTARLELEARHPEVAKKPGFFSRLFSR